MNIKIFWCFYIDVWIVDEYNLDVKYALMLIYGLKLNFHKQSMAKLNFLCTEGYFFLLPIFDILRAWLSSTISYNSEIFRV